MDIAEAPVSLARAGHVALVSINRPRRMNALDPESSEALSAVWDQIRDDDDIWAAVLSGAGGRAFCTGFDLKWRNENPATPLEQLIGRHGFGGLTRRRDLYKPVVAAVQGYCLGGGFEIALACDLIVAGASAVFGFPEPRVGNVAGWGGVQRLARSLPPALANLLLLTGRKFSAPSVADFGLLQEVVPDEQVLDRALALAEEICRLAPLAVQATKALYLEALDKPLFQAMDAAAGHPAMVKLQVSADHDEGNRAFTERREPRWTGR